MATVWPGRPRRTAGRPPTAHRPNPTTAGHYGSVWPVCHACRMAKTKPARTLLEVCIARGGYLRGARVAEFVIEWTIAADQLGHQPSVREFSHWWKDKSERTTWRRLDDFKTVFPEFDNPAPIAAQLLKQRATKRADLMAARLAIA